LLGVQTKSQLFSPLFSLSGIWLFAFLIGLIILNFLIAMRLFDIGKFRALCFMIAVMTLLTLTGKVLISCAKFLHKHRNQSLQLSGERA
jgi:hypothetical protein